MPGSEPKRSGAMYATVPTIWSVRVCWLVASSARAMPKSITLGLPGASSTLRGFRSRWMTPAPWIAVSAVATPIATPCRLDGGQRAALVDHLGQARPVDVLDDQVGRVVVGVGVEHLGGAERRHLPGPVDLAAEPPPELVVRRQVGPHHLDRDQRPGRVAGQVDGAHAALAEPAEQLVAAEPARVAWAQRCVRALLARHCRSCALRPPEPPADPLRSPAELEPYRPLSLPAKTPRRVAA